MEGDRCSVGTRDRIGSGKATGADGFEKTGFIPDTIIGLSTAKPCQESAPVSFDAKIDIGKSEWKPGHLLDEAEPASIDSNADHLTDSVVQVGDFRTGHLFNASHLHRKTVYRKGQPTMRLI